MVEHTTLSFLWNNSTSRLHAKTVHFEVVVSSPAGTPRAATLPGGSGNPDSPSSSRYDHSILPCVQRQRLLSRVGCVVALQSLRCLQWYPALTWREYRILQSRYSRHALACWRTHRASSRSSQVQNWNIAATRGSGAGIATAWAACPWSAAVASFGMGQDRLGQQQQQQPFAVLEPDRSLSRATGSVRWREEFSPVGGTPGCGRRRCRRTLRHPRTRTRDSALLATRPDESFPTCIIPTSQGGRISIRRLATTLTTTSLRSTIDACVVVGRAGWDAVLCSPVFSLSSRTAGMAVSSAPPLGIRLQLASSASACRSRCPALCPPRSLDR